MNLKNKLLAGAATLALVGGVGTAGALTASAATPSCGNVQSFTNGCVDLFARDFGTHRTPGFVLDVLRQGAHVGQPLILFRSSNSDPAEDFQVSLQGTVSDLYATGLVSSSLVLHYGGGCATLSIATHPCTDPTRVPDDFAFELEYAPYGVDSGLCVGVGVTAAQDTPVSLQPCGVSAKSIWVIDQADSSSRSLTANEYVPLINGSDTNFSHPFVLTYPKNGYPTDQPRPQVITQNLTGFTNPGPGAPTGVQSDQLWGADLGVLR